MASSHPSSIPAYRCADHWHILRTSQDEGYTEYTSTGYIRVYPVWYLQQQFCPDQNPSSQAFYARGTHLHDSTPWRIRSILVSDFVTLNRIGTALPYVDLCEACYGLGESNNPDGQYEYALSAEKLYRWDDLWDVPWPEDVRENPGLQRDHDARMRAMAIARES